MEKIYKKIDSYTEPLVELQRELVAIPALSPLSGGDGEYDKVVFLEKHLEKFYKFDEITRIDAPDPKAKKGVRPNLIARYKGKSSKKTMWVISHTDIVPPGEASLWKTDPYVLKREGNKLYGRGSEDNHHGLCSGLFAVKALMDLGLRPQNDVALLFAADEETGSGCGLDYIVEHNLDIFGKDDCFVVPDGGNSDATMIEVAEKSIVWLRFRTVGKQCHGSMPEKGINSFRAASDLVVRLNSLYKKYSKSDSIFDPPISTFEPTKKEANVPNINTIPGDDVFYLDSRILPCYDIDDVKKEIRRLCDGVEKDHGVKISFEPIQEGRAATPTPTDSPLVKLAMSAIKEIHGANAKPMGIGGGTVAAFLRRKGFHAIVYSKIDESAHQPNEYCQIDNLLGDAKVFANIIMSYK